MCANGRYYRRISGLAELAQQPPYRLTGLDRHRLRQRHTAGLGRGHVTVVTIIVVVVGLTAFAIYPLFTLVIAYLIYLQSRIDRLAREIWLLRHPRKDRYDPNVAALQATFATSTPAATVDNAPTSP